MNPDIAENGERLKGTARSQRNKAAARTLGNYHGGKHIQRNAARNISEKWKRAVGKT
ncbi:hypothetical protein [Lysinibacillus sp. fls2-241-R2A-57]|uniref:hypothetical protein n=1 Tax=Lysinibacillus sp. fls2-241-R2A-57 TaxID=3040292 RepID=UPI0025561A13|nr:hypothetical protein [Lysinibacillus sp. fls2-241-R2A-57]